MRPRLSRLAGVPALCLALAGGGVATAALTSSERSSCQEHQACWDCRTMGDHICEGAHHRTLIYFNLGGELHAYDVNAPDRPGCFVEPTSTPAGFEVIAYGDMATRSETLGFEVPCP